jgi:hypothetical protein
MRHCSWPRLTPLIVLCLCSLLTAGEITMRSGADRSTLRGQTRQEVVEALNKRASDSEPDLRHLFDGPEMQPRVNRPGFSGDSVS